MDKPTEKPIRHLTGKVRKVDVKKARSIKMRKGKVGVTKREFFAVLDKASQPVKSEAQSDSEQSQT